MRHLPEAVRAVVGVVEDRHTDWEDHLRAICMAYNTSVQATTVFSPFYLMFGREARMPLDILFGRPGGSPLEEVSGP